jgi:SAM-dependent methyltransferase
MKIENGMVIDETRPWLGGFKPGPLGDEATYFPSLWIYLVEKMGIKSVCDIGCGAGIAVKFFEELLEPSDVMGIDGIAQDHPSILEHDYTLGPFVPLGGDYDLVWCCEFLEHLAEQYLPNILSTIRCGKLVLLTHAEPGQAGHHHVNCQTADYWKGVMASIGYRYDINVTQVCRLKAAENTSPWNHFTRSGMAFARHEIL